MSAYEQTLVYTTAAPATSRLYRRDLPPPTPSKINVSCWPKSRRRSMLDTPGPPAIPKPVTASRRRKRGRQSPTCAEV